MSSSVTLSSATRQNLLSLQDTAALTSTTQNRLSTGLKVSSALDNPVNFFTAQGFSSRSGDLGALLDSISNGIQTIQAANQGITSIQKLIDSAKSTANQALTTQLTTTGTAKNVFTASATTINFYVNGTATTAAVAATDTIDATITTLNTSAKAAGAGNIFSKDTSGTRIVLNASADIEFADTASQTALGFQAGGTGGTGTYGTGKDTVGQSADLTVAGVSTRNSLAQQFNSLLTQITQLAKDASFNGVNLISSNALSNKLHIAFNEKDTSNLDIQGKDLTSDGLGLTAVGPNSGSGASLKVGVGNFLLDADIKSTISQLGTASDTLRAASSTLGSNLSVVQNRQDFTKKIINILDTGASNLTSADLNEEAANSQALTTRQSLGISALSLANQAQQGILQLLR